MSFKPIQMMMKLTRTWCLSMLLNVQRALRDFSWPEVVERLIPCCQSGPLQRLARRSSQALFLPSKRVDRSLRAGVAIAHPRKHVLLRHEGAHPSAVANSLRTLGSLPPTGGPPFALTGRTIKWFLQCDLNRPPYLGTCAPTQNHALCTCGSLAPIPTHLCTSCTLTRDTVPFTTQPSQSCVVLPTAPNTKTLKRNHI